MSSDEPRVIKRYANRKLYDTALRKFTTLDELSGLLDKGVRFVVRDHDSGADRTDDILAQVLGRRVRGGTATGSNDLLSGLLRAPTQIAQQLVGEATGKDSSADESSTSSTSGKDKSAKDKSKSKKGKGKKKDGGKSGGAKAKKKDKPKAHKHAPDTVPDSDSESKDEEIQELRSQVAELTQAVSMLVNERLAEREEPTEDLAAEDAAEE